MQNLDELFDVVDEQDRVIGRQPRREVHRLGLRHRAIHVLVFNARGEVYLQKRSMTKDTFPGAWDSSCSGHVDAGEDYDATTVRELREEIGLVVAAAPARLFRIAACDDTGQEFVWVYRLAHEGPMQPNPAEVERGEWFTPAHVTRWIAERPTEFARAFRLIWKMHMTR
ncbi:MAG: NUDIX domain-containing protein [Verrucomicrobia bacterium]|nr:NUDIX domain-containing protein [Verrucomicrobiota bacterium]